MNPILNEHKRRNRTTRSYRDQYANHRELVTQRLLEAAPQNSHPTTICLLGAGNCNDVNLKQLAHVYQQIHLVDLDQEALTHAVATADESVRDQLVAHSPLDITGVSHVLAEWKAQRPSPTQYQQAIALAHTAPIVLAGEPFDVVASCCLLSQLLDSLVLTGVAQDALFLELLFAIRDRHLELVWHWTKPGGTTVVISDFVSTVTLPELEHWNSADLAGALPQLIEQRNFFTGTNPVAIRDKLSAQQSVDGAAPTICGPWKWTVGKRAFGVAAVIAEKQTDRA